MEAHPLLTVRVIRIIYTVRPLKNKDTVKTVGADLPIDLYWANVVYIVMPRDS